MRTIAQLTTDLTAVANDIASKKKAFEDASVAVNKASEAYESSKTKASELRLELNDVLNEIMPMQFDNRVRRSA